jgi:hypothetical protein
LPSQLYEAAYGLLAADAQQSLHTFREHFTAHSRKIDGDTAQIWSNIEAESHMTVPHGFGDSTTYGRFLAACGGIGATDHETLCEHYSGACQLFAGQGLDIPAARLPELLFRYSRSVTGFAKALNSSRGSVARDMAVSKTVNYREAFEKLARQWSGGVYPPDTVRLAGRLDTLYAWATFDHPATQVDRSNPTAVIDALALPISNDPAGDNIVYEMKYHRDMVTGHRFPTVADAGMMAEFRPAPEVQPDPTDSRACCGWTHARGGEQNQPEILHNNAPVNICLSAPRLIEP